MMMSVESAMGRLDALIQEIRSTLGSRGGYVVYLRDFQRNDFLPTEAELKRLLPLRLVRNARDGAIYSIAPHA